jgi:SPP1 gp7 family putative phage head morphogenesis protein
MADTAERLHDLSVRHRISLSRYSTTLVRRMLALLNRTDADIVERIVRADNLGRDASQLEQLLREVRGVIADGWAAAGKPLRDGLAELSGAEAEFNRGLVAVPRIIPPAKIELMSQAVTGPQIYAAANARPFQGRLLREWLSEAEEGAARRVRDAIRIGFVESQTIDDIVRRIRGTRANSYRDGVLEISRRGAETMVRTAVSHTANVAAQETYNSAAEYIEGVIWIATLDSRTSEICRGRDGKMYPINSGPRPPAHLNCRSVTIPKLRGMEPFPRKTYAEWLAGQDAEVQADILGKTKAKLFRDGGLKLDKFVDRAGKTITLAELRARDASAFARAGL